MTATVSGFSIDPNAADIQPLGTQAAGSTGQAADASHVHPTSGGSGGWPGTTLGDTAYGASGGAATRLPGNTTTTRKFWRQKGTGSVSAAPAWDTLQVGDLPAGYGTAWINATAAPYNADPTGASDSTSAINNALTAASQGQPVYLPTGIYKVTAPILIPPGGVLLGDFANEVATYLDSLGGTVIQPSAAWSNGGANWNGIISILGQSDGGYGVTSEEQKVLGLMVDCHLLITGSADGIQLYGGVGRVRIENCLVAMPPGNGFNTVADGGGSAPGSYRLKRFDVRYAGGSGFVIFKTSDISAWDCLAENCAIDGWTITNLSNGMLTGCRAEHNGTPGTGAGNASGNGFTYICTSSGTGSGTALFNGCSSDRNQANGIEINSTNGSGVPVQLNGCRFRRDGQNTTVASPNGAGGNNFAGIYVHGFPGSVLIGGNTTVFPGVNDDSTGTLSPQIGVRLASNNSGSAPNTYIAFGTSHIQGASTGISDDGTAQEVRYSPTCFQATGTTGAPVVLGPREGFATLSSGTVVVPTTLVQSNSRIFLSYAATSGTPGILSTSARTAGTSFTITSLTTAGALNTADNSGVYWWIGNP